MFPKKKNGKNVEFQCWFFSRPFAHSCSGHPNPWLSAETKLAASQLTNLCSLHGIDPSRIVDQLFQGEPPSRRNDSRPVPTNQRNPEELTSVGRQESRRNGGLTAHVTQHRQELIPAAPSQETVILLTRTHLDPRKWRRGMGNQFSAFCLLSTTAILAEPGPAGCAGRQGLFQPFYQTLQQPADRGVQCKLGERGQGRGVQGCIQKLQALKGSEPG